MMHMSFLVDTIYAFARRFCWTRGACILMYHSISDEPWAVSPDRFAAQMRMLINSGRRVVSLETIGNMFVAGKDVSNIVAITFDDGYRDNYLAAFPVLKELGLPATIFVITDAIGREDWMTRGRKRTMLTISDMREMMDSGLVSFGSHTVTHMKLTRASDSDLRKECSSSKEMLETFLGSECVSVAYPFGDCDSRVAAAARNAGYRMGVAVIPGLVQRDADVLRLPRNTIDGATSDAQFAGIIRCGRITRRRLFNAYG